MSVRRGSRPAFGVIPALGRCGLGHPFYPSRSATGFVQQGRVDRVAQATSRYFVSALARGMMLR